MPDISQEDAIALNVLGVQDLVESSTNKIASGGLGRDEGVTGELRDVLELDDSDEELIRIARERTNQYSGYEAKITPRQATNKKYYLGQQNAGSPAVSQAPLASNLLFQATETFLAASLAKNPDPVVYSDNSEVGNELSGDVKTMLQYHAEALVVRSKLQMMVRQWNMYHLGVLKYGWDDEIQEVKLEMRKIQNFLFDPNCGVDAYGDFPSWLGERITCSAKELLQRFPDMKFEDKLYIKNKVEHRMGTPLTYTEWWEDDKTYSTFDEIVLDKAKNPNFNYPKEEEDEFGIPVEKDGMNHFAKPKKPYVFLSVFSLEEQPHDMTGLIEQNIPQQNLLTKRTYQADKNISISQNSVVVSEDNFNQQTGKQAATARENGDPILIPSGRPIAEAITTLEAPSLPDAFFKEMERNEQNLLSIYGVNGITAEQQGPDSTARGMILNQQRDNSRIGGGIGEAVERVAKNVFNGLTQMYYVYYDQPHWASVLGQLKATEYTTLSNDRFSNGGVAIRLIVTVSPDSMKPKDELTVMNQAIELWQQKALDIKTLLVILNFPDPQKTAAQVWLYNTNPQLYGQMNFPELEEQIQEMMMKQQQQQGGAPGQPGQPSPTPPGGAQPEAPVNAPPPSGVPQNSDLSQVPLPA